MTSMSVAIRLSSLLPKRKYERRPRIMVDRRARNALSRDRRWKRRSTASGITGPILAACAGIAIAATAWAILDPIMTGATSQPAPIVFPDFVAQAEASFPEAIPGYSRVQAGTLMDGHEVPVGLTLLLPAHALDSASAAPDALTRLSAPFIGTDRAISGDEMGKRIAMLAELALPKGVSRCYTYDITVPRRITVSETRTLTVAPLEIAFNPEC